MSIQDEINQTERLINSQKDTVKLVEQSVEAWEEKKRTAHLNAITRKKRLKFEKKRLEGYEKNLAALVKAQEAEPTEK